MKPFALFSILATLLLLVSPASAAGLMIEEIVQQQQAYFEKRFGTYTFSFEKKVTIRSPTAASPVDAHGYGTVKRDPTVLYVTCTDLTIIVFNGTERQEYVNNKYLFDEKGVTFTQGKGSPIMQFRKAAGEDTTEITQKRAMLRASGPVFLEELVLGSGSISLGDFYLASPEGWQVSDAESPLVVVRQTLPGHDIPNAEFYLDPENGYRVTKFIGRSVSGLSWSEVLPEYEAGGVRPVKVTRSHREGPQDEITSQNVMTLKDWTAEGPTPAEKDVAGLVPEGGFMLNVEADTSFTAVQKKEGTLQAAPFVDTSRPLYESSKSTTKPLAADAPTPVPEVSSKLIATVVVGVLLLVSLSVCVWKFFRR